MIGLKCVMFERPVTNWCCFARKVGSLLVEWIFELNGEVLTVEIDESKFGKLKYNVRRLG